MFEDEPSPLPLIAAVLFFCLWVAIAHADPRTDCPTPTPCKVITVNADEEKALMGERMVFDTAVAARQLDMFPIASYFKNKLQAAPAGDAPKPPEASTTPPVK